MALPNDVSRINDELSKLASASTDYAGSKKRAARTMIREQFSFEKTAADGAAGTTTAYSATPGVYAPRDGRILGARILPHGALTADNTNNAVINIDKSDGLGGAATIMAAVTTNVASGNWVAGAFKAMALSATPANTRFTKGQLLSFDITKGGTGVVVPACTIIFDVEWEGADDYEAV